LKDQDKLLKDQDKLLKDQKKALNEAKKTKPEETKEKAEVLDSDEEEDSVVQFEYQGKKYLKSINDGTVYNMEQDAIGKWDDKENKIVLASSDDEEEEEEEYEE